MRPAFILATLGASVAWVCLTVDSKTGDDPMLAVELLGAAVLAIWISVGFRKVLIGRRLARVLDSRSVCDSPRGVPCRIVRSGGRRAFVLGTIRPQIYIGDELFEALDADELHAVLLHEEHHRRTLAPLRATALEAWLTLVGRAALARIVLLDRLMDLEMGADADALRRGADPSALASALLKADPSFSLGTSFATASTQRLRTLVALGEGAEPIDHARLPYEWLPAAAVVVGALVCQLTGLSPFG